MAKVVIKNNILWIPEDIETYKDLQFVYNRFYELQNDPKIPWILMNINCSGSSNVEFAKPVYHLLSSSKKPIKTQVMSVAQSYGLVLACIGEERVAWPEAQFMHHNYIVSYEDANFEKVKKDIQNLENEEKVFLKYVEKYIGVKNYKKFIQDFKKNGSVDMFFDAKKAVDYNIVNRIGIIEPFYYEEITDG
jgi:ATP-dependent protease ClpP protease subunit